MSKWYDIKEGLAKAWKNWRYPELVKFVGLSMLLAALMVVATIVLAGIYVASLITSDLSKGEVLDIETKLGTLLLVYVIAIIMGVVYAIINFFYFAPRIARAALKANGVKVPDKLPGMIDWLILHIRIAILNMACWYDKKLLIPAAIFLILGIFSWFIAPITTMLFVVLTIISYMAAAAIHGIRIGFAPLMFLRGDGPENKMPKASENIVRGKTFQVALALFLVSIIMAAIYFVLDTLKSQFLEGSIFTTIIGYLIIFAFVIFRTCFESVINADIMLFYEALKKKEEAK
jgi:hypothetical protein